MPTDKYTFPVPKGQDVKNTKYQQFYTANKVAYGNQTRWVDDPNRSDPSKGKFMRLADWEAMQADKKAHPGAYQPQTTPTTPAIPGVATTSGGPEVVDFMGSTVTPPASPLDRLPPTGPISPIYGPQSPVNGKIGMPINTGINGANLTPEGSVAGVPPSWWLSKAYANPNDQQAFANAANAILPSLSPEDQRTLATYLATNFKDVYGSYANPNNQFAPIPTSTEGLRNQYLNPQRVQNTLSILEKMRAAAPGSNLGTGFDYLTNALQLMNKYTTPGSPMTREQYTQFTNAIKALNASTGSDVSAYKNLATMFNLPGFSAGQLVSNEQNKRLNT